MIEKLKIEPGFQRGNDLSVQYQWTQWCVLEQKSGKWVTQIGLKGKTYYLGTYSKIEDAVRARERAGIESTTNF